MTLRPCLNCGEPTSSARCPDCATTYQPNRLPKTSPRARGYTTAWDSLSRRARRLQPFCSDCYTTADLTTDHLPGAWQKAETGKPLTLADIAVVCRRCNSRRGATRGEGPLQRLRDPWGKAKFESGVG